VPVRSHSAMLIANFTFPEPNMTNALYSFL
jgi:hypothetical protein